ncbi:hypothetical protein LSAT2_020495 [Lamellibrachia satsuma]|nr:hypothetical protein LSAT2_020495 [Lamellibrachia satsuma]
MRNGNRKRACAHASTYTRTLVSTYKRTCVTTHVAAFRLMLRLPRACVSIGDGVAVIKPTQPPASASYQAPTQRCGFVRLRSFATRRVRRTPSVVTSGSHVGEMSSGGREEAVVRATYPTPGFMHRGVAVASWPTRPCIRDCLIMRPCCALSEGRLP